MGKISFFILLGSILLSLPTRAEIKNEYNVICKAKVLNNETGKAVVQDFKLAEENDRMTIYRTQIDDINFELQDWKLVFFFKPYIRFADGMELTTTGYFDAAGVIRLEARNTKGIKREVDIRCCRDCTFSDWPKK